MHKKTLNIISVCAVLLVIVFSMTQKSRKSLKTSVDTVTVDENGKVFTKADQYKSDIISTVSDENVKNFQKFSDSFQKNSSDNLTDGISKDIMNQYIKYNTSGSLNTDDITSAATDVMNTKADLANPTTRYDIEVNPDSAINFKNYGNNLALIQEGINNAIISTSKKTGQTPYLGLIYANTAKLLLKITVPESLADTHVDIINGFRKYSEGTYLLDQQNKDPAKALIGLTMVKGANAELLDDFNTIIKTITLNNINYSPSDPGYVWISNNVSNN